MFTIICFFNIYCIYIINYCFYYYFVNYNWKSSIAWIYKNEDKNINEKWKDAIIITVADGADDVELYLNIYSTNIDIIRMKIEKMLPATLLMFFLSSFLYIHAIEDFQL